MTAPQKARPSTSRTRPRVCFAVALALALTSLAASCAADESSDPGSDSDDGGIVASGDCITVDMAVSPEKVELLTDLARTFNGSDEAQVDGECVEVVPQRKSSGTAMRLLAEGWDEDAEGARPVIWSPAASSWGAILNQRLSEGGEAAMAPEDAESFMLTPLVIAMPEPMAQALGYPATPVGWADIARLATSSEGWAAYGHPEWGQFRLGKTNPNFSTSGLNALIAQTYAATGRTTDLTTEDLADPAVVEFGTSIESSVVHYGDITATFLENWYRADQRGTALTYASAVAVEEKSVLDYNAGNPDGVLAQGEEPREPRIPLVAIYPTEGTLNSDNPFFVLDAEWVSDDERAAAEAFTDFVRRPANQERVLEYGFRPANPEVEIAEPIVEANGVDPNEPQTLLEVPQPAVLDRVLDNWADQRKGARVMLVIDVSGSMGEPAGEGSETKLDLAKSAAIAALDQFKDDDLVGLRIFTTALGDGDDTFVDLIEPTRIGDVRERLTTEINRLIPLANTPLYDVTAASFEEMADSYDPTLINAVILLSDGVNDDGDDADDRDQYDEMIATIEDTAQGEGAIPVRIFPIAYGSDADLTALGAIAEASNGHLYDSSDPTSIDQVFTAVVSNF